VFPEARGHRASEEDVVGIFVGVAAQGAGYCGFGSCPKPAARRRTGVELGSSIVEYKPGERACSVARRRFDGAVEQRRFQAPPWSPAPLLTE
jgi:hypothetical protein